MKAGKGKSLPVAESLKNYNEIVTKTFNFPN